MPDIILDSLFGEQILHAGALATVTENCVVLRDADGQSHTILAFDRLNGVRTVKTTYPALLVVAAGLLLMAAAAQFSKEGDGAAIPFAVLSLISLASYFLSRRASLAFGIGWETAETIRGTLTEAAALLTAVQKAQAAFAERRTRDMEDR